HPFFEETTGCRVGAGALGRSPHPGREWPPVFRRAHSLAQPAVRLRQSRRQHEISEGPPRPCEELAACPRETDRVYQRTPSRREEDSESADSERNGQSASGCGAR